MFECPPPPAKSLPMNARLAVGFGDVTVRRDDAIVWEGDDEDVRLHRFEMLAQLDPESVWTVRFYAPLIDTTYRRVGLNEWVLVQRGQGFA